MSVDNNQVNHVFTYTKLGYKIMIILNGPQGSGKSTIKFLYKTIGSTNTDKYVFDPNKYSKIEILKKRHQEDIFKMMREEISPIIVDNTDNVLGLKPFCEVAVECGYLIEILHAKEDWPLNLTREDLFNEFKLTYKQELPQLRKQPPLLKVTQNDDTQVRDFIRLTYSPLMLKDEKRDSISEQMDLDIQHEKENAADESEEAREEEEQADQQESILSSLDKNDESNKNSTNSFEESTSSNNSLEQEKPLGKINNLKSTVQTCNVNTIETDESVPKNKIEESKIEIYLEALKRNQEESLQKQQVFIKSSLEDINKRFVDNMEMISKRLNDFQNDKEIYENQLKVFSLQVTKHLDVIRNSTQENINKTLEKYEDLFNKKMENIVMDMKIFIENETKTITENIFSSAKELKPSDVQLYDVSNEDFNQILKDANMTLSDNVINSKGATKKQYQKKATTETLDTQNDYAHVINSIKDGYKVMILLRGLPGSGKSHLATHLLNNSVGDTLSDYIYMKSTHRKCFDAVKNGISPIIIDDVNLQIEDMRIFCAMGVEFGYIIEVIEINTPWAFNVPELLNKINYRLNKRDIQTMLQSYQRNVTSAFLLKQFNLSYKETMPQFRKYPPIKQFNHQIEEHYFPDNSTKKYTFPEEYIHKFEMKQGEKYEEVDDLVDISDETEVPQPKKNIYSDSEMEMKQLRKTMEEQSRTMAQMMTLMANSNLIQSNITPINQGAPTPTLNQNAYDNNGYNSRPHQSIANQTKDPVMQYPGKIVSNKGRKNQWSLPNK